MKQLFFLLLLAVPAHATTYFVRPDGGTRYSTNVPTGRCNGTGDAADPGSGSNQNCAFGDVRYLWQDGSYTTTTSNFPAYGWILASGDTAIIRGSIGTGVSYRVGWPNASGAAYGSGCSTAGQNQCFGVVGDNGNSGAPPPPSGTSGAHTRILGENYAACHTASAKAQLHGGYGVFAVVDMTGVSYVDVACIDVTDFSNCGLSGQTNTCATSGTLSDFARYGILWSNASTHDSLTDVSVHGTAAAGMLGPTGTGVTMDYLTIRGNPSSGWNADRGNGTTGTGSLLVTHFDISWNGCAEEYPIVDTLPYQDCTDDQISGYGDGFGTTTIPSSPAWNVAFDQGTASYNTQDGLDALHITGAGSSMTISRTLAYGNMGNQLKVGGTQGTVQNSIEMENCYAMRSAIPGTPFGFNSRLTHYCRAAGNAVALSVGTNTTVTFRYNTVYAAGAAAVLVVCEPTQTCDTTSKIDYRDNIVYGFLNSTTNGFPSGGTGVFPPPIDNQAVTTLFTNSGSFYTNNLTYHTSWACPDTGESNAVCSDPLLTDGNWHVYGYADVTPTSASPSRAAGVSISGITTDYSGATRPSPPAIGAYEYAGSIAPPSKLIGIGHTLGTTTLH